MIFRRLLLASIIALGAACASPPAPPPPEPETAGPTTPAASDSPSELRAAIAAQPIPGLSTASDVAPFVAFAIEAPMSRREEIRATIQGAQGNAAVANALIADFERAVATDFSHALVTLSLLGEQRNPAGTQFLIDYVARPLPERGAPMQESGVSAQFEAAVRLQAHAALSIGYARTDQALEALFNVVSRHPSAAVRAEAAASILYNWSGNTEVRAQLSQRLRREDRALLDRPVRTDGMSGAEFNRRLALYLEAHPELRPPPPARGDR